MSANASATMYESIPVVSELNRVQGFDPLKFLRRTKQGERNLDLKYKKLWFRLKYPTGRIKLSALKITDQLAIIEARVYFDKNDTQPKASFIAQRDAKTTPGGLYIEYAQHAAIDQALSDAGFGIQFTNPSENGEATPIVKAVVEEAAPVETVVVSEAKNAVDETVAYTEVGVSGGEAVAETVVTETVDTVEVNNTGSANVTTVVNAVEAETEGEEVEADADEIVSSVAYTADMPVEDICSMMTVEEAGNVIVPIGTCKDWTMSQVADRRPASLKWYINGYSGNDNILRAAATIMQSTLDLQKAS